MHAFEIVDEPVVVDTPVNTPVNSTTTFMSFDKGDSWSGDGGVTFSHVAKVAPASIVEDDVASTEDADSFVQAWVLSSCAGPPDSNATNDVTIPKDDVTVPKAAVSDMRGDFFWMLQALMRKLEKETLTPIQPPPQKYGIHVCFDVSSTGVVGFC